MIEATGVYGSVVAFDLETVGTCTAAGRQVEAIQIGATMLDQATLVPTTVKFERKLRIERPERIEPGVLGVYNHYDPVVWEREAVSQAQGWQDFCDWFLRQPAAGGSCKPRLLGHNIGSFDYPLTMLWTKEYGLKLHHDYHLIDTTTVFDIFKRTAGIKRWGLSLERDICPTLEVKNPKNHDALCDAMTDALCFALMDAYSQTMIDVGRGYTHLEYLDESYRRIGYPRKDGLQPLPRKP